VWVVIAAYNEAKVIHQQFALHHIAVRTVLPANTTHIADVVREGRKREVQPIFGSDVATEAPPRKMS
jgi:hypothetical protein